MSTLYTQRQRFTDSLVDVSDYDDARDINDTLTAVSQRLTIDDDDIAAAVRDFATFAAAVTQLVRDHSPAPDTCRLYAALAGAWVMVLRPLGDFDLIVPIRRLIDALHAARACPGDLTERAVVSLARHNVVAMFQQALRRYSTDRLLDIAFEAIDARYRKSDACPCQAQHGA